MYVRSLFIVGVAAASVAGTASDAEARRFRLFSSPARAATPNPAAVKPDAALPKAAVPAVPAAPAAKRSGSFVFIGGTRPAAAPAAAPQAEEPARRTGEAVPMLATITDAPARSQEKQSRPAVFSFETVSGPARGFEVVKPRDPRSVRVETVPVASAPAADDAALRR
jgi:hypothetical protein